MNDKELVIKAIQAGNVDWSDKAKEYFRNTCLGHDFTLTKVELTNFWGKWTKGDFGNKGGMEIIWETVSAGFGRIVLIIDLDNKVKIETQGMDKDFCKAVFAKMIDDAEVTC